VCIFHRIEGNQVFPLIVYVDDVLVLATEKEIRRLETCFMDEFWWIMLDVGSSHSYLGMQLSFLPDAVRIDMSFYIKKILSEHDGLVPVPIQIVRICLQLQMTVL